jgi:ABC-type transporter Mla MlaB component
MVTKSSSTRLLSRFAQLFRDSDVVEDADSRRSGAAVSAAPAEPSLKERLARKRRNDAIRAKEFNQLRAVLQFGRGNKRAGFTDLTSPTALVRTSGMGALERNSILDKIDGAEAHLENWWGTTTMPAPMTADRVQRVSAASPVLQTVAPKDRAVPAALIDDMELDFTDLLEATGPESELDESPQSAPPSVEEIIFSPLETCVRDAALHFAEGEFNGAMQLLEEMLADASLEPEAAETLTFSLFDVYRCTGQQDRFDVLALEYANRFGRSPGEWFSLAEVEHAGNQDGSGSGSAFSELAQKTTWRCPPILDRQSLADCISRNPASAVRSFINWEALQHIDNAIAPALTGQLRIWCNNPVELHWSGIDALLVAVQMCKISGDASRDAAWWLIHLDLLSLQHQAEAYEDMAMEYCVTFEMSPPSWQAAKSRLINDTDLIAVADFASTSSSREFDQAEIGTLHYATCELQGHLTGDAKSELGMLHASSNTVGQITVQCSRLGRVDFNAASALLNWAVTSDARGCQVQFTHLPRLVLVFFEMLGMHKVAHLSARTH